VYETIAGLVDVGETKEMAMKRELLEETGYKGSELHYVGQVPTSSGLTNEIVDCFVILGAEKTSEQKTEASESIETLVIDDNEWDEWYRNELSSGSFIDPKLMMLVSYYRRWIK
jgi:ADP-ribose pyrophosphatase